jgi:hypothetical protein
VERTEVIGQVLWEHGNYLIRSIDTRPTLERLTVEDGVFRHILGNISNIYTEFEVSIREAFDRNRIIEVFRIGPIDGYNPFVFEIYTTISPHPWPTPRVLPFVEPLFRGEGS